MTIKIRALSILAILFILSVGGSAMTAAQTAQRSGAERSGAQSSGSQSSQTATTGSVRTNPSSNPFVNSNVPRAGSRTVIISGSRRR